MKFHFETGMRHGNKKRFVANINKGDCLLPFCAKQREELFVARMPFQRFELRLANKMRKNDRRVFHRVIIASICCIVLTGCGHKTDPVYVPDNANMQHDLQAHV